MSGREGRSIVRGLARALSAAAVLAAATAIPAGAQTYTWRMTTYIPQGTSIYRDYMQVFIDTVTRLTDGQVKIQGYGVGVIAGFAEGWKAVQQGTADIAYMYPGFGLNIDPANALFAGFPGGMSAEATMHWVYQGEGGKLWEGFRHDTTDLHPVVTGIIPTEMFMHSHRPVASIEDLEGLKIRTAGAWADIVKEFGASPVTLAPADIFTALERKVIDATEFITPTSNLKVGYHKIAKYIIIPGVHAPAGLHEVVWRTETWNKLPRDLQQKLTDAGRLAGLDSFLRVGMADLDAMEEMRKGRNEWITLPPSMMRRITEQARAWADEKADEQSAKGNPWMRKLTDSYFAFLERWEKYSDYRIK